MNKKVSSLTFRPLKYLPTYLQKCNTRNQYVYEITRCRLNRWGFTVHTTLESYNCAATYDQSSITTHICYVSRTRLPILSHSLSDLFHTAQKKLLVLQSTVRYVRPRYVFEEKILYYLHNSKCLTGKRGLDGKNLLCE